IGTEYDEFAVGRVAALGVIAGDSDQTPQFAAVRIRLEDVQIGVEVPFVAAPLAGLALLLALAILLGVLFLRVGIEMTAGEDNFLSVGRKIRASGLADAGADAAGALRLEVHDEDLIKRIAGIFFFRLEDNAFAVGREVPLAGADEIRGNLADVFQMDGLSFLPVG